MSLYSIYCIRYIHKSSDPSIPIKVSQYEFGSSYLNMIDIDICVKDFLDLVSTTYAYCAISLHSVHNNTYYYRSNNVYRDAEIQNQLLHPNTKVDRYGRLDQFKSAIKTQFLICHARSLFPTPPVTYLNDWLKQVDTRIDAICHALANPSRRIFIC